MNSKRGISHLEWSNEEGAHLKISCHVDQPGKNEFYLKPRHWWVEVEALEGAFQEIGLDDLHMNKAPASGYNQTVYRVERVPGAKDYTSKHTVRFYYYSDFYASLYFDIGGLYSKGVRENNPVGIYLSSRHNSDGGRLLEVRK